MVHRYQLPRMLIRGVAQTVTADIYSDAGTQQTATAGTYTLFQGSNSTALLTQAVASFGPPASTSIAASVTASEDLATDWMEIWSLTIGGVSRDYQRPVYLVRRELYPTITDTDLLDYHTDLADVRDPANSTFQGQRDQAWTSIQKRLIERGNFPQLIMDDWALREIHVYKTLELIFRDAAQEIGDGRWKELAGEYARLFTEAWDRTNFRYDQDQEGTIDADDRSSAPNVVWLVG